MSEDLTDADLIREALAKTTDVGSKRAQARALGVSEGTLRIWRAAEESGGAFPALSEKVRNRLRNVMGFTQAPGRMVRRIQEGRSGYGSADAEFWRRVDDVERSDLPELAKILKLDALAAAYRAHVQNTDASTAAERTQAVRDEIGLAAVRQEEAERRAQTAPVIPGTPPLGQGDRESA